MKSSVRSPASNRWGAIIRFPLTRILLALLFVAIPFIALQRVVSLLMLGRTTSNVLKALVCTLAAYGMYRVYVRLIERRPAAEVALRLAPGELGRGVMLGSALFATSIGVLALLGVYQVTAIGPWSGIIIPLAVATVIGTFEEIVIRGIIFRITEESLGTWLALAISAVIFGLLHLIGPASTLQGAVSIMVGSSVLLTGAYKATGRLWFPIGIHAAWNFTQGGIFGVVVSGHPGEGVLQGTLTGPGWLTGGSFGAEGSVVATLVCLVAGVLCFAKAVRIKSIVPLRRTTET
ncbi:MAG: type II CAAX endopeptidase family protein [Verrucomicrobiota bacterium]